MTTAVEEPEQATSVGLKSPTTLTVVVPAFNEERGIAATVRELLETLQPLEYEFEIIVVDDGSSDRTAVEAEECGVRVIRHAENCGYGASLKSGILASRSDYILITDADGTYPCEAIPELLRSAPHADMVVGARSLNSAGVALARRPAKWILNQLAQYLAGKRILDLNSGLRVFRRSMLLSFLPMLPNGFSFTTTITLGMLCNGHKVVYVPIDYRKRLGTSKLKPVNFLTFIVLVLRTIVLFNPLKVFLPVGGLLFAAGLVKLVYDLFLQDLSESAVMAFLAAMIVWSLGLLADMIGRLHLRPPA
jgi:glycosyltransferase involved in cell wall biosynthesis